MTRLALSHSRDIANERRLRPANGSIAAFAEVSPAIQSGFVSCSVGVADEAVVAELDETAASRLRERGAEEHAVA
ncbi:MAG: hypothetical protein QOK28_3903 [Actinomycetota bacterium]